MEKITITKISKSTFESGVWIEYKTGDKYGYELDYVAEEGMEEITEKAYNTNEELNSKAINKSSIDVCSKFLKEIIEECLGSENEMWFVEYEDLQEHYNIEEKQQDKFLEKIEEETIKLGISEDITFGEDGAAITVYGGVITKFLF